MPAGRPVRSRDDFVAAATALVEERGWDALTIRSLGEAMGIDHTVVYRHFRNKDELIGELLDATLVGYYDVLDLAGCDSPRERVLLMMTTFRGMVRERPHISRAIMERQVSSPAGRAIIQEAVRQLEQLGLSGLALVQCYQALETATIGAAMYDFSGGAGQLALRLAQYRSLELPAFEALAGDAAAVAAVADDGFRITIEAILDAFIRRLHG